MANKITKEMHKQIFIDYAAKSEQELNDIFNLGFFNEICKGYLVLAMKSSGADREEIEGALNALKFEFDERTAADARAAYKEF